MYPPTRKVFGFVRRERKTAGVSRRHPVTAPPVGLCGREMPSARRAPVAVQLLRRASARNALQCRGERPRVKRPPLRPKSTTGRQLKSSFSLTKQRSWLAKLSDDMADDAPYLRVEI